MKILRVEIILGCLIAIFMLPCPLANAKENSLKKGKWALQFEVNRLIDINAFQGSTLSIKKHTSDKTAYRLGLTLHFDIKNESNAINFGPVIAPGHHDFTNISIRVAAQKVFYVSPQSDVNFFWGVGPLVGYGYFLNDRDNRTSDNRYVNKNATEEHSWSAGLSGVIGTEWFATKSISFLAEYETSASYTGRCRRIIRQFVNAGNVRTNLDTTNKLSEFKLSSSQVKFGLSVYF